MHRIVISLLYLIIFSCSKDSSIKENQSVKVIPIPDKDYIYEMRTYNSHPGKLRDLENRFRNHTNTLFIKHGMNPVGYWTIIEGDNKENTLFYIIAHSDRSAAKESWSTFIADPEWKKVYKESRKNGPLVSKIKSEFMQATDYSPIK